MKTKDKIIKNRWTGDIIYLSSKTTYKEAVEEAVKKGINLEGADLRGVEFKYAYLKDANFKGANLIDVDFEGADLRGVNFKDSYMGRLNLKGAHINGANFEGVDLKIVDFLDTKFYGRGGNTKIKKNQIDDFLYALGVIVED